MPPPGAAHRRSDISLSMTREYKKVKPKGKLSEIIDFHLSGRNRYMVINQQRAGGKQNSSTPTLTTNTRNPAKFRNPLLNKYDDDGEDDYQRKHYVFEDDGDEDEAKSSGNKGRRKKKLAKNLKKSTNKDDRILFFYYYYFI